MSVKMTGVEFKKFMDDKTFWPEGAYYEDEEMFVNGVRLEMDLPPENVKDSDSIAIRGGFVYLKDGDYVSSFVTFTKRWLKQQTCSIVLVEVPKEHLEAVTNAILTAGGRIL